uniref:Putative transcription factor TCP14-like n=1 Tax=Davidia involucrata TaxID=16924 RepID=A0A5B7A7X4_DAVIN
MSVPSQLRSTYFNPNFSLQQSRSLFPDSSTLLNFQSSNLNPMLQAKQELRDTNSSLELSETTEESMGRKRRHEQELMSQQHQMGSYAMTMPAAAASHGSIPANFWMLANSNNQVMGGDPIWTFPSVNNSALYRGTMSSGLHFMNFPTPVALLPGQQLGTGGGAAAGGGGGGNGGGGLSEGHLSMLAGLNPYRPVFGPGGGISESQASGDDRHDTTSHHS